RLRQPQMLLHIENVDDEHLATAVVALTQQLAGCAVLVSARQQDVGLSSLLRWERVPLSPLPNDEGLEQLTQEFRPPKNPQEASQFQQIIAELGALPLAIHLIASRLKRGQRLDSLLKDLTTQALAYKAVDPGERSRQLLAGAITASIRALEQALREDGDPALTAEQVAPALAGFAQGPAAGVGDSLAYALLGLGDSLGETLLLRARGFSLIERIEEPRGARWRMHPLIAATASRTSSPSPEAGLTGMGAWFQERLPQKLGEQATQQAENWQAIQAEEAALLLWLERLPPEKAAEVAHTGGVFACICGPYAAWGSLCKRGLAVTEADPDRPVLLQLLCDTQHRMGQLDAALQSAQKRADLVKASGADAAQASAQGQIADIYQARGQLDDALRILREEVLLVFDKLGDIRERAVTMGKIADIYHARGKLDEALRIRWEEVLPVFEKLGDIRSSAVTMGKIADIYRARGQLDEALRIHREEVLPVYQKLGDIRSSAVTMGQIADIYQARGQLDEALRILREEVLLVFDKLGDIRERAVTMGQIADIYQARGQFDEALRICRDEELPVYERLGLARDAMFCRWWMARYLLQRQGPGDRQAARGLLSQAYDVATALKLPEVSPLGRALAALSDERPTG
ncbi:MAG TPA: tetratricopeptide repeat protein, partial [Pseudomonadota bacterium]|nr:tetratricopeptide repeat protein [Pseudomonadota bacterium]